MSLITRALTAQDKVFDLSAKPSESEVRAMVAAVAPAPLVLYRYVFFGPPKPQDLDAPELQMLLRYATVCVVVHVPYGPTATHPGWIPTPTLGQQHSQAAVANCVRAGYVTPDGSRPLSLCTDMEGTGGGDAMGYAVNACDVRVQNGYAPEVYTGFLSGLSVANVNALAATYPTCTFWCDFASMAQRPAPARGFDAHQGAQTKLAGVDVDPDTILHDGLIFGLCDADFYVPVSDAAAGS